jgi:hypothetical protein
MLPDIELGWLEHLQHAFLIRHPDEMIPSLHEKLENFDLSATGLPYQVRLFEYFSSKGKRPPVLDARCVLEDPAGQLRALCQSLDVTFDSDMLSWPLGPRDSDGVWAPFWYENVEKSTGFQPYVEKKRPIPHHLKAVYEQACVLYKVLIAHGLESA